MESSSHDTESLVQVLLSLVVLIATTELDAGGEQLPHVLSGGHDTDALVCNVVLHAGLGVDAQLSVLVNGTSKSRIIVCGVDVVGIVFGVVDVLLRAVAAKSFSSDLELARSIAKCHESEDAKQETDGLGGDSLDGTDVDGLRVVTEPVSKVDSRDGHLVELLAIPGAGHGKGKQGIFDITVSPWK